jgi:uncharacterized protein (DUF983 family)
MNHGAAPSVARATWSCRCPCCGRGKLYDGLLTVTPRCPECGLDFAVEDAGDGPAG